MIDFDPELLDDEQAVRERDTAALLWQLAGAGATVRRIAGVARENDSGQLQADLVPRAVLVATDSVVADVASVITRLSGQRAPALVWHSSELPSWAGPADVLLVGCVRGMSAHLAELIDMAQRRGLTVVVAAPEQTAVASAAVRGVLIAVPDDLHPWVARWSVLTALLWAGERLGLFSATPNLAELADQLDAASLNYAPSRAGYENPAKTLAVQLCESYPVVVGHGTLAEAAAESIAHSLQRIAGQRAIWAPVPTGADRVAAVLSGNEVADLEADFFRDRVDDALARPRLIMVGGEPDIARAYAGGELTYEAVGRRAMSQLQRMAERSNLAPWPVDVPDAAPLSRYACAAIFGDFVATYLALACYRSTEAPGDEQ